MNQTLALAVEIVGRDGGAAAVIERARQGIGGLVSTLGRVGLAGMGLQAVTSGARELGNALGLGLASEMEQVRAQFLAFTKDAALTDDLLARVRAEADKTPFSFRELATATAGLIPASKQAKVPLDDLIKTAEILAASNPAQGLEGAALALREAVSGDFVSVVERFNLPRQRINELKEQGVPALKAVQTAMREMGFDADLVANMAGTAAGKWSTFMDTVDGIKASLATPIFEGLKVGLGEAQAALDANKESIAAMATALGQGLAAALSAALTGMRDLGAAVGAVNGFLSENKVVTGALAVVLGGVATAYGLMTAAAIAHNAATLVVTAATSGMATAQAALNVVMTANPIGLLVVALGALVAGLVYAYQNSEEFRAAVDGAWEAVKAATATAWDAIQPVLRALGDLWGWLSEHVPAAASTLSSAVTGTIQGLSSTLSTIWEGIKAATTVTFGLMVSVITGDWESASTIWQGIMERLGSALSTAWEGIKSVGTTKWGELKDAVIAGAEFIRDEAPKKLGELKDLAIGKLGELVAGVVGFLKDEGPKIANQVKSVGLDMVGGILAGAKEKVAELYGWFRSLASGAVQAAKDAIEARSPSHLFAREVGVPIVEGIIWGIELRRDDLMEALTATLEPVIEFARETVARYRQEVEPTTAATEGFADITDALASVFGDALNPALGLAAELLLPKLADQADSLSGEFFGATQAAYGLASAIRGIPRFGGGGFGGGGGGFGGGGLGGDGGVGGSSVGARAMGGPVTAGRPYLVGELGPEVIVPRAAGTVVPNHALGGGLDYERLGAAVARALAGVSLSVGVDDIHAGLHRAKRRGMTFALGQGD